MQSTNHWVAFRRATLPLQILGFSFTSIIGTEMKAMADQGESAISAGAALSFTSIFDQNRWGSAAVIDYEYGLTEAIWLRASAGASAFYNSEALAFAGYSYLGLNYILDVLRYVPHIDVGVGGLVLTGGSTENQIEPMLQIGVGLDLLTSRSRSYGFFARVNSLLDQTTFVTIGGRMSWRSGFF